MALRQFFVAQDGNLWYVDHNGNRTGPYQSEALATEAALDAAMELGTSGVEVEVLDQDESGQNRSVWTNGPLSPRSRR